MIQFRLPNQKYIILLIVVLIAIYMLSCSRSTIPTIASRDTVERVVIKERVRDTTVYITDSAGFRAALKCDSLGMIHIQEIKDYYNGQFVRPKVVIRDNWLKVDCKVDSASIYLSWKERDTTRITRTNTVVQQRVNYLTSWQTFQVWCGRILFCLILIYIGVKLVRRYTGIKL